jgi:molecular chaperone DnaJ
MDFYVLLGLERGATVRDIQRAYRRLARRYHPDINPGDRTAEALFRQIVEAYETLSDPDRRRRYDNHETDPGTVRTTYRFEGFDFSEAGAGDESTFGDLFADLFRRADAQGPNRPEQGVDLHASLSLGFERSLEGGEHPVTVTRLVACVPCRGLGVVPVADGVCPACQGTGTVVRARGHMTFAKGCPACAGTGREQRRRCSVCHGEGVAARSEWIVVRVPPGVPSGTRVRVPGKGHVGRRGGQAGDLYVTIAVAEHEHFRREGDDLVVIVPVAVHEAALGARVAIPTPGGPARLRIPPGTQAAQRFRLRGRGAPLGREGQRGDLVAEIRVVLPRLLDERSKELLREFGRLNTEDVRAARWGELTEVE